MSQESEVLVQEAEKLMAAAHTIDAATAAVEPAPPVEEKQADVEPATEPVAEPAPVAKKRTVTIAGREYSEDTLTIEYQEPK